MAKRLNDGAVYEQIKLTDSAVHTLKPHATKRRIILDTGAESLYLVIQPRPSGGRSWMMRFRRWRGGPIGKMVIGPLARRGYNTPVTPVIGSPLSLRAARRLAADLLHQKASGTDLIVDHRARRHRQRAEAVDRSANSFPAALRDYVDQHLRRNVRRWREIARVLGLDYPIDGNGEPTLVRGGLAQRWADRAVGDIDEHEIYAAIEEARRTSIPGITARATGPSEGRARTLARSLSSLFGWLKERRKIETKPAIDIPKPPKDRDRVLDTREIRALWHAVDRVNAPFAGVVRLLLLSGCRRDELADLQWSEIAEDGEQFTIPSSRTKNQRPHVVPLSALARSIIAAQPRRADCPFVFTIDGKKPIAGFSGFKRRLDALMPTGVAAFRIHDLRRTAATHMAEMGERTDVIEAALNHVSGARGGIIGIYNRATLLPERRDALARWAQRVQEIVGKRGRS
jgi:integrase